MIYKCDKLTDYTENPMFESREFLYKAVSLLKPKRILELGTESGCSFFAMAQALSDTLNKQTELLAVDAWAPIGGYPYNAKHFDTFRSVLMDYQGLNINYKQGTFEDVLPKLKGKFDFIIYDGSHVKGDTEKHYQLYKGLLAKGGLLFMHDVISPKCDENWWWWEYSKNYPSWDIGGRFGLGVAAPNGDAMIKDLRKFGLIRFYRLDKKCV